mmetsp:Transcript_28993/g.88604  ORF Transcript_28993/g.88604 Transcript_28993/m.88604 type:complete len:364 (-) Transcript_28993:302-1393(-)
MSFIVCCCPVLPLRALSVAAETRRDSFFRRMSRYGRVLIVVKHTPYEAYAQLKVQGKAPKQLRWERLKDRFESHRRCVDELCDIVRASVGDVSVVSRDELGPQHFEEGVDLVIPVGGDGTVLSTSHYVNSGLRGANERDGPVVLGVNSDPTKQHERTKNKHRDERRSFGALCYASANDMAAVVPEALAGRRDEHVRKRHRLAVTVRSTLNETRLPPALNDVLLAHPSPAAVSRFRLEKRRVDDADTSSDFAFNVWSSGLWIASATGSTAAIASAGGLEDVPKDSADFQYVVREHLLGEQHDQALLTSLSRGRVPADHLLQIRWNSQHGTVFVDGAHTAYDIELGDNVLVSSHGCAPLRIFAHS